MSLANVVTRIVGQHPPHHPEPLPEEPFTPVYHGHRPLGWSEGRLPGTIREPRAADRIVFGVPLERHEVYTSDHPIAGRCGRCDVTWTEGADCWICGRPAGMATDD